MKALLITVLLVVGATSLDRAEAKNDKGKGATMEQKANPTQKQKYNPETCSFPKDDSALKKLLTPEQYEITRKSGTERPFQNAYWNNHHPGLYIDVISKEPLFSSKDKFDSGSGWPSFSKPLKGDIVKEKKDSSYGMDRVEIRSTRADSHLGHVFDDGPGPEGLRYCINSASLQFVPLEKMKEEGYEDWISIFDEKDWEAARKKPWKSQ